MNLRSTNTAEQKRIAILEFVCGGGMVAQPLHDIPKGLLNEGRVMLHALASDWSLLPDWNVFVGWDPRFGRCSIPRVTVRLLDARENVLDAWRAIANEVDFVLVIAPEIDNRLIEIVHALRKSGANVINSDTQFLNAASDKWLTAQSFRNACIPHPETALLEDAVSDNLPIDWNNRDGQRWVIKPRDGAGCHEIRQFGSIDEVKSYTKEMLRAPRDWNRYILQPWLEGTAGSVSVLCGPTQLCILPAITQNITVEKWMPKGSVRYSGGTGPWQAISQSTLTAFANRVIRSLPGSPLGWIGIDFIATDLSAPNDSIVAIEVNPRLTTSYLGVREILPENLADLMIRTALGQFAEFSLSLRSTTFDSIGKAVVDELY